MLRAVAPRPCRRISDAAASWGAGPALRTGWPAWGSFVNTRSTYVTRAQGDYQQKCADDDCPAAPVLSTIDGAMLPVLVFLAAMNEAAPQGPQRPPPRLILLTQAVG